MPGLARLCHYRASKHSFAAHQKVAVPVSRVYSYCCSVVQLLCIASCACTPVVLTSSGLPLLQTAQEQVVQREHRKESVRMRKQERDMMNKAGLRQAPGAAAAAGDAAAAGGADAEEEEAIVSKGHVITYCALDYPRIVDSVRWRLYTIKETLQVNSDTLQDAFAARPASPAQHSTHVLQLEAMHSPRFTAHHFYCLHTAAETGLFS